MSLRWHFVLNVAETRRADRGGRLHRGIRQLVHSATRTTVTVKARDVPVMAAPQVRLVGRPFVGWNATNLQPGEPVHQYVGTRHVDTAPTVVCEVPALLTIWLNWLPPVNTRIT